MKHIIILFIIICLPSSNSFESIYIKFINKNINIEGSQSHKVLYKGKYYVFEKDSVSGTTLNCKIYKGDKIVEQGALDCKYDSLTFKLMALRERYWTRYKDDGVIVENAFYLHDKKLIRRRAVPLDKKPHFYD